MSKIYKTAAGQHLNMDQLRLVNEKEIARSHNMVAAARGYVIGMGFKPEQVTVKPEEQVATRSADHIVRR